MIRIKGLHKFFNKGRQNEIHVINDISLELPERGMVAIFGKSGCGKTTLLNVIGGLDKFGEGEITVENQSIRENTDLIRNKYIGYIFQNYNLNQGESCFDNVADALRLCGMSDGDELCERVCAALRNVDMEKYKKRTPDTLSGGQQQRIAIARAIVKNPRIILADEPTGNLDEANTVMIMKLLKAISREHLVLLVTHEEKLVDYYCDTVIELSDGKVVDVKQNSAADGYFSRDKNTIYLGELEKSEFCGENAKIEYYGDKTEKLLDIKIINSGGKLYIHLGKSKVQILDESSEVKLREGVYEERADKSAEAVSFDTSPLPSVNGSRFGRLFSLKSSVKSGYNENFKKNKKGKKLLRNCLVLFASVVVFMSSVLGSSIGDLINAKNAYNHNVFYLYTPNGEISQKVYSAIGNAETGIDYVRLSDSFYGGDGQIDFRTGSFETFTSDFAVSFSTNAVYLDVTLTKDMPLICGKRDNLAPEEILISTKVADALLEKSTLGYISEREDLIGLISTYVTIDGKNPRIAGIVESDEPAVYFTEIAMAKYVRRSVSPSATALDSDFGVDVSKGEAVLVISRETDAEYPKLNEVIKIQGRDIKVTEIKKLISDYGEWLLENGKVKLDEYSYFSKKVSERNPELQPETDGFLKAVDQAIAENYYEYLDYYYSEYEGFFNDCYFFQRNNINLWLFAEKGIDEAKYRLLPEEYYKATVFKEQNGRYPTVEELSLNYDLLPSAYEAVQEYYLLYEEEFNETLRTAFYYENTYLVDESDYVEFSRVLGETHPTAMTENSENGYEKSYPEEAAYAVSDYETDYVYVSGAAYSVIHSNDPEQTSAWLSENFADLKAPYSFMPAIATPDDIFSTVVEEIADGIIGGLIAMGVLLVIMGVCMYFIMRSSLLSRIKEVGIYRAIGVSKKNMIFKFFVESAVLFAFTVFIGFLLTSAFIYASLGISSIVKDIFYYPPWLCVVCFVILFAFSLFFGTLPIISLLFKTPSEILAKYDI